MTGVTLPDPDPFETALLELVGLKPEYAVRGGIEQRRFDGDTYELAWVLRVPADEVHRIRAEAYDAQAERRLADVRKVLEDADGMPAAEITRLLQSALR